jgi:hypothetical protein
LEVQFSINSSSVSRANRARIDTAPQVSSNPLGCCGDRSEKAIVPFVGAVEAFNSLPSHGFGAAESKKMEF